MTDERTISGVTFHAVRLQRPVPHWRYSVAGKEGPQGYDSRPAMWSDLERAARLRGEAQWQLDWKKFECPNS